MPQCSRLWTHFSLFRSNAGSLSWHPPQYALSRMLDGAVVGHFICVGLFRYSAIALFRYSMFWRLPWVHDMLFCLPFTDGALKGHFGKVLLAGPPLSVAVKLLCLQHVREVACQEIQGCEVSISVRYNDDSCLASLDPVRTYFTIPMLCFLETIYPHLYKTSPTPICA